MTPREAWEYVDNNASDERDFDQSKKMREALAALRSAVEDQERLDWLTAALRASNIQLQTDYDTFRPGFSIHSAKMDSVWGCPDLRSALDAARTPNTNQGD